jgi:hypothetical protein
MPRNKDNVTGKDIIEQRPWVGLTDEELWDTEGYKEDRACFRFARAIEAKLKEKYEAQ